MLGTICDGHLVTEVLEGLTGRSEVENFRLKVFRTVTDNLNFRQTAEAPYLTHLAVTLQIKALEEELGVPLFDRTENRVALTEAGQILRLQI
jgi:DNA-binding transcriptional LysR family regulator